MKKDIKTLNYYDAISQGYKNLYHEEQTKKIILINEYFPKRGILLDLGSGDGVLNKHIIKNVKLISFDLSYELLKLNDNGIKIQGSIHSLPFKDNSIDFISSFTVFQDLSDVKLGLLEAKRVLKKDGIFILSFLIVAKDLNILLDEIKFNFEIVKTIKEEKDYIFVLKIR